MQKWTEDIVKVKESLKSHVDNSHNLQTMASYMKQIRPGVPEANRVRNDAKEAFEKSLKDELMIEKKVKDWTAKNKKWLRQRRKEKNKEKGEPAKTTEKNSGNPNWLMNFARDLKPDKNLKNDGDLTAMRQWKQSMIRYTNYIRRDCEMTP